MKPVTFEGVTYEVPDDATDDEVLAFVGSQAPAAAPSPSWSDLPGNIIPSGKALIENTGNAIVDTINAPVETAKETAGGVKSLITDPAARQRVADFYTERYGSLDKFKAALIKDPVGVLAEVGPLAAGGLGVLKAGAKAGAKVAATAGVHTGADAIDALKAFRGGKPAEVDIVGELVPGADPNKLAVPSKAAAKAEAIMADELAAAPRGAQGVIDRQKWLGRDATLADSNEFGPLAETSAQYPAGKKRAKSVLEPRAKGAEERLLKTVDDTLSDENFYQSLDYQRATRSAEAQPLRRSAMDNSAGKPVKSDVIQRLQKDSPYFNQAMALGKKIAKEEAAREGIEVPTSESWWHGGSETDAVHNTLSHVPTLRMLDAAKQGYQELLKPYRNQFTGQIDMASPEAVELSKTVEALTDTLRQASPDYAKYLDTWSEHSQQLDALDRGRKLLKHDPEITMKVIRNATPNQRLDMQTGLARALKDKIRENPQAAAHYFDKGVTRDKMRALFGKGEYRTMHRQVLREIKKQETRNRDLKGSATSPRQQAVKDLDRQAEDTTAEKVIDAGTAVATGGKSWIPRAAAWGLRKLTKQPAPMGAEVADEISKVLHTSDVGTRARALQRFQTRYRTTALGTEDIDPLSTDDLQ